MILLTIYIEGETWIKPRNKNRIKSILEVDFENGLILYVFPGSISKNDIIIKFKDTNLTGTKIRQPSHIHWVVDILIKKENECELTNQFLKEMLKRWDSLKPLEDKTYDIIVNNLIISKNQQFITKFEILNKYGFFSIEFIIYMMELLMLQEKTNYAGAYMFKNVVEKTIEGKDLYSIISKAKR
ncbi:hypothetical protein LCGC14_1919640 [marine sediment metagenome]|uniref:Uncharacterized protein n=1 Tax=marine sediment metagenome TaxID=412755 RepID=A0A0F9FRY1_9ZZZZ